jgi:hypothetical protein
MMGKRYEEVNMGFKLTFGAAKDKGGYISVRAHQVVIEESDLVQMAFSVLGLSDDFMINGVSMGIDPVDAYNRISGAMAGLASSKAPMARHFACLQALRDSAAATIKSAREKSYEDFGVEIEAA